MRRRFILAMAICTLPGLAAADPGAEYVGDWNGQVPHSMQILDGKTVKICREDLKLQCQFPVPYSRDGDTIVVEKFTAGLRWTYTPRGDGSFDATFERWNGSDAYDILATAVLRPR